MANDESLSPAGIDGMPGQPYPRDMIGYGPEPPRARWPGDARIAVQCVLNYEEGGESCVLHGDAGSEAYLSELVGTAPLIGARNLNMESMYEYGSRVGFWRLHRLFTEFAIPVTVFGVTLALERNPKAVEAMLVAGWEIASHGYRWIDYQFLPEAIERTHIARAIEGHRRVTGRPPDGWYTGRISPNTRRLIIEAGGFLYDADSYADDLPYWVEGGPGQPHLVVPYTLDANDMRFAMPQGFNNGDQFFGYLRDTFDVLYQEGAETPRMMSVGVHCRISGRPGRCAALARFFRYARGHRHVWFCTRADIARYWHAHHRPGQG